MTRGMIHPMEQQFHDHLIKQEEMFKLIDECWDECKLEGHTDHAKIFKRGFVSGAYHYGAKKTRVTYDEWLDLPINGTVYKNRDYIPADIHHYTKIVFDLLMKEFAK